VADTTATRAGSRNKASLEFILFLSEMVDSSVSNNHPTEEQCVRERRLLLRWSEVWFGSSILFLLVGLLRSLLGVLPLDAAGPTNKENIEEKMKIKLTGMDPFSLNAIQDSLIPKTIQIWICIFF
jgi:hypothetical protein